MARPLSAALPLAAAALLSPAIARACAVCGAGQDPSSTPFLWSTLALSALPLLMLGAGVGYVLWRLRGRWAEEFDERQVHAAPIAAGATSPDSEPGGA